MYSKQAIPYLTLLLFVAQYEVEVIHVKVLALTSTCPRSRFVTSASRSAFAQ